MIRKILPGSFNRPLIEEARKIEAKQDRGRRRFRLILLASVIIAVLGIVLGVGYFSNIYRLDAESAQISFADGEAQVDDAQIRSVLAEFTGAHLFFLGGSDLEEKLLAIPEVAEVSFETSFTGDFSVAVTPSTAVICIGKAADCQAVDKTGKAFNLKPEFREKIAKLTTLPKEVSQERLAADIARIRGALPENFDQLITNFAVTAKRQYLFDLGAEKRVIWGVVGDDEVKAKLLSTMYSEPFKTLDFSNPNAPIAY
ncbi:MAG: hypothetical protein SPG61_06325 [Arcanobacterium sp.]|nr:hypothetical protein [Arcanobacterium sp.]